VAAFDGLNKISLDLKLEEEISHLESEILEQVDELVTEVSAATEAAPEEESVANSDVK
jgi:hypothetical protein